MLRGVERLLAELDGSATVAIDTNACIYYLADDPRHAPLAAAVIERAMAGRWRVSVPAIVEMELLTGVYLARRPEYERRVVRFLNGTQGVSVLETPRQLMRLAALTRSMTRLRTPDALVVSSAMLFRCPVLIGNDRKMKLLNRLRDVALIAGRRQTRSFPRYLHLSDYVD